ncbi:hypothetical protein SteCoe_19712 [Stentor coeruleus]|uniref:RING-type domain-containing protein n=1 Tax=Stentor coeruleus TaxID=5963 RepID=A0A1R2BTN2_9CILI|nr:hypothetical protein SteCoe_19712 [Stentor coeruleus]
MEIQVGNLELLPSHIEILSCFKGIRKINPIEASPFISMAFAIIQTIIKHKNSEVGYAFINRLNSLIEDCSSKIDIRYLSNVLKNYVNNEVDPNNFILHIINTEGALIYLAHQFCYFFKYLTGGNSELTCVSIKFNKDQLNIFCSRLGISMLVVSDNGRIDFLGGVDDNILIWLYEENAHHSALVADFNIDYKNFPFRYKKAMDDINRVDFEIVLDKNVQGFQGFTEVVRIAPPNFSFFIAFSISLMHILKTSKSTSSGQDFIEKIRYVITQTISNNPNNGYISYFYQAMEHFINYDSQEEITTLLSQNREATKHIILGLDVLLKAIFPNEYTNYYNEIKYSTHKNLFKSIAETFDIVIIIYEYPNLKHVIGTPQVRKKLLLTFGHNQNSFCFYIPDKTISLKSYPNMISYDQKHEILSKLMTSWEPIQKKFIDRDKLEMLKIYFSFTSESDALHDFSQLKTLATCQPCQFNHNINLFYILSCGHAHCTECLFTDIRSYNREDIKCYTCNKTYEDHDIMKIVKKVLKINNKLELIEKKIILKPIEKHVENIVKLCLGCKINRKQSNFLLFKCQENCDVCFRCRLSSSNYCIGCRKPLPKDVIKEIAQIKCEKFYNDIIRDKGFLCMICKRVNLNTCKFKACDCSDVCIKCAFGRDRCLFCDKIIQNIDVMCCNCQKVVSESKDLFVYQKCGHQAHIKCKYNNLNEDSCLSCISIKNY